MTNFERIKAMTVDEIAQLIDDECMDTVCHWKCKKETGDESHCPFRVGDWLPDTSKCFECIKEWLTSEVEDE